MPTGPITGPVHTRHSSTLAPRLLSFVAAVILVSLASACGATGGPVPANNNLANDNTPPPPDPADVRFEWLTPPPAFVTVSPYNAQLRVTSPVPVTRLVVDGAKLATPDAAEFTQPLALAAGVDQPMPHTIEIFIDGQDTAFASTSLSLQIDDQPPGLQLHAPAWMVGDEANLWNEGTASLEIVATDNTRVTRISVNGEPIEITPGAEVRTTAGIELAQGLQMITIDAGDVAGNSTRLERKVHVDSLAPALEITAPVAGLTAFTTDEERIALRGVLRDVSGVASLKVGDIDVELAGADAERSFSVDLELEEGANSIECVATDMRGNSATIMLTVIRGGGGAATTDTPDGLVVPDPPGDELAAHGVWVAEAAAQGDTPEAAMAALQITALGRLINDRWNVRADMVTRCQPLRDLAATLHVDFSGWTNTGTGWFCTGTITIAEDTLLPVIAQNARSLTAFDRRPAMPPRLAQLTLTGTIDVIAVLPDGSQAGIVFRDGSRVQVALASLPEGNRGDSRVSSLAWTRVTQCRMFSDRTIALVGTSASGAPQGELLTMIGVTPGATKIPLPPGGIAWHVNEPLAAGLTPDALAFLRVPTLQGAGKVTSTAGAAPGNARLVGYGPGANSLIALGSAVDEFGIRVPGTLMSIDVTTGEVTQAWQRLDTLLAAAPDLLPASLDASDVSAVTTKLEQLVTAAVSGDGTAVLLGLPRAAIVLDAATGQPVGPVFPLATLADRLGKPLRFSIGSRGRFVVANGPQGGALIDPHDGRVLVRADGATLLLSAQGAIIGVARGGTITLMSLDGLTGALLNPTPAPEVIVAAGGTLALQVTRREGDDITSIVREGTLGPLGAQLRSVGYNFAPATDDTRAPRIRVETWASPDAIALRVSIVGWADAPVRLLLGNISVTRGTSGPDGQVETDASMHARLFSQLRTSLAPIPSRICRLPDAAHDLPLLFGAGQ
ncbi:MAG: hypothetical protein AB7K09_09270 [Planctomycetota bacterium]